MTKQKNSSPKLDDNGRIVVDANIMQMFMHANQTQYQACAEFIDNSFGEAAGNADAVHIVDCDDGVVFIDQGRGMGDLNGIITPGFSQSRHDSTDIGKFGIGAVYAMLAYGTKVKIESVHNGEYRVVNVDWAKVAKEGVMPKGHNGRRAPVKNAHPMIRKGGTAITISALKKDRQRHRVDLYSKNLGMKYKQALLSGKDLFLYRTKSVKDGLTKAKRESIRDKLADILEGLLDSSSCITSSDIGVKGLPASGTFGLMDNGDKTLSGIHLSYGGRTITTLHTIADTMVPSRLYGEIELGSEWKGSLSFNKSAITRNLAALEKAVLAIVKPLLSQIDDLENKAKLQRLSMAVSNMMDSDLGDRLARTREKQGAYTADETGNVVAIGPERTGPPRDNPEPTSKPLDNGMERKVKPRRSNEGDHDYVGGKGKFGFKIITGDTWHASGKITEGAGGVVCTVEVNESLYLVEQMRKQKGGAMTLCLYSLARAIFRDDGYWVRRFFEGETADEIMSLQGPDRIEEIELQLFRLVKDDGESKSATDVKQAA